MPELDLGRHEKKTRLRRKVKEPEEEEAFADEIDDLEEEGVIYPKHFEDPAKDAEPEDSQPVKKVAARVKKEEENVRSFVSQRVSDDYAEILDAFSFGVDSHKISIERKEPQYDPLNPARRIAGHLQTYTRPVDLEEIKKVHGGGRYNIVVRGPNENGRGSMIKARKEVEIAGPPIIPEDPRADAEKQKREEARQSEMMDKILERDERRLEEERKERLRAESKLQEMQMNMLEVVSKLNDNKPDPNSLLTPVLAQMQEQRRQDEERRREERDREEKRLAQERDERRRQEDREREERKAEREAQQQQFQLQLEQMKAQQALQMKQLEMQMAAQAERAKAETTQQQQYLTMMIEFMKKGESEKMQMVSQMNEQQRSSMEMQMKWMIEQGKNKSGFVEELEKFTLIRDLINPPEPDERTGFERAIDKLGEYAPGIVAGISSVRQPGYPQQVTQVVENPQAALPPAPRSVMPGSIAVVENIDDYVQPPVPSVEESSEEVEQKEEQEVQQKNPLKSFPAKYQGSGNKDVLTELVYRIDLAVQQDLEAEAAFDKCVEPLPKPQKNFLKLMAADDIVSFVEAQVPESWDIRSVAGEQLIRQLHAKLVER